MCLKATHTQPKIAEEDIVCYKVLRKIFFTYWTPYTKTFVRLNHLFEAKGEEEVDLFENPEIRQGFIHAFLNKQIAIRECFDLYDYHAIFKNFIIVKAIIKKGTKYFLGKYGDICAKEIFITNEMIKID
jgi:hypothetical protein